MFILKRQTTVVKQNSRMVRVHLKEITWENGCLFVAAVLILASCETQGRLTEVQNLVWLEFHLVNLSQWVCFFNIALFLTRNLKIIFCASMSKVWLHFISSEITFYVHSMYIFWNYNLHWYLWSLRSSFPNILLLVKSVQCILHLSNTFYIRVGGLSTGTSCP